MKRSVITMVALGVALQSTAQKPNIVFILADDLGWSDLSIMGSDYYETPHIDKLASESMVFRSAYSSAANSAPSRACILSGKYSPRHGVYTVGASDRGKRENRALIPIVNNTELDSSFVTMAEALHMLGYDCVHIGKWHLGRELTGTDPVSQGFDVSIGSNDSGSPYSYFFPYCKRNGKCHSGLDVGTDGEYLSDRLTNEAINYIKSNKETPFFLLLSHFAVHTPIKAPENLVSKYRNKPSGRVHSNPVYAAMIENLDMNVGRLLQTIDDLDLEDNTILVFYSDNGGSEPITDNYPLRSGKGSPYEGGIRVPLIIKAPGILPAGEISDIPVAGIDLFPTFLSIASGSKISNSLQLDGENIFEILEKGKRNHDLFWHFPAYLEAYSKDQGLFRATPYSMVRSNEWKLIYFYESDTYELYNINNDVGENTDLSMKEISVGKKLKRKLDKWLKEVGAPIHFDENPYFVKKSN